ncbi:tetrahydromethanopterin S-methyltransferase subunit A [Methanocella arvoryzae]|uniref:Tetrahydromethanopterin S-methyltransferase subunit A n=1 Tax=Methanocella arvoryzae (strain DSM 22066 / NBRC 105507 / MRE50) TaxID=351160 RepID=Q0W333_METAR|nr:tetrahydromethanopterin S-methyltransferase subunit A [Methanocella arvoryzae]CAJ37210.1 N(5)-methyltetrahydromethanopterin-coenzyme M methyltransferase, subunit A [Methanocella arvoryzae MRE50]
MVEKKEPAKGWPVIKGEFDVGDPKSCVAVATAGSHFGQWPIKAGAAISGPFHTENLGIEKIVANVISNPNIRFIIITGAEVKGHISGDALECLHKNGLKGGRIVGAKGAIPFIENLDDKAVKRFQEQVQTVYMIDVEDEQKITAAIKDCIAKDPGAFAGEPMLLEIKETKIGEEEEEAGGEVATTVAAAKPDKEIPPLVDDVCYRAQLCARNQKLTSAVGATKVLGFVLGAVFVIAFVLIPVWLMGGI